MDPFESAETAYRGELFSGPSLLSLVAVLVLALTLLAGTVF